MHTLQTLFPPNDFFLLAFILVLPLIGAAVNGVFGKRLGPQAVSLMALVTVGGSFIGAVVAFFMLKDAQQGEQAVRFLWDGWHWFSVSDQTGAAVPIDIAFSVDALSGTMALIVTGVGFLIHLYSTKYMEGDPGYHRYFAYLNLFIFAMLVLILGNSLPVLFIGWEGVGLCSYLLIGFWFEQEKNAAAGKKAFIANRIGDFGLLVGMMLLVYYAGALNWSGIQGGADNLLMSVQIWPIGPHVPLSTLFERLHMTGAAAWLNRPRHVSVATLVGLSLFLGCAGKSAQIPLYVWLPDAMAGPTPVSALIHAATMVTAGVYLVCRMAPVFVLSPAAMFTVAFIGACTAFFAATIAIVQNDIKRVLAYSTVSQLGYMFMGVGVGAFTAGFFHVITHAFFKAGLFLGAGSVIHAMHKRIHDHDASQDMRNMGGLKHFMPVTFWTFIAFTAAIVALPGTAGFFSKDEILFRAYTNSIASPVPGGVLGSGASRTALVQWPKWGSSFLYVVGVAAALLTAFYMTRLVVGMFAGEFKGWTVVRNWRPPAHEEHDEHGPSHGELLDGPEPAETPWQMTLPLVVLGLLSVFGGLFDANTPWGHFTPLDHFLHPVFASSTVHSVVVRSGAEAMAGWLLIPGVGVFLLGCGIAYWMYMMKGGEPARALRERAPRLYALVYDKWRIDELYQETILGAVDSLAEFFAWADRWIVDGIIARVTSFIVAVCGNLLRYVQTGRVQAYAAVMVVGAGGLGWFLTTAHADASLAGDNRTGAYTLTAAPGLGYQYRWDQNGDGKWDTPFGGQKKLQVHLNVGKTDTVRLEVKNAFGRSAVASFRVHRPRPDLSGPGVDTYIDEQTGRVMRGAHNLDEQTGRVMRGAQNTNDAIKQLQRALKQMGGGQKP